MMGSATASDSQQPALFEREAPLEALRSQLGRARLGQGGVAVVQGEAGIGKTSLIRALVNEARADCRVLWGGCEALSTSQALGPLFDMIGVLDVEVASALHAETPPARLFPVLFTQIQQGRRPTVMVIEDIHWADQATLDFVKYMGRRIGTLSLLLVISHRTDEAGAEYPIAQVLGDLSPATILRIPLAPLSAPAVEAMARRVGRDGEAVYHVTQGNPFFITEILAYPADPAKSLPPSVRDAVWARVARLDETARHVLELLSLMPGGANRETVCKLVGRPTEDVIDRCIDAGMLVEVEAIVRFRHELARQAVMSLASPGRRRTLHARVGSHLAASGMRDDPTLLTLRMHHAAGAGDGGSVLKLAPVAATHAARVGAHRQAADHLAAAIPFIGQASVEQAAQLYESWSYEAGLSQQINDDVIEARHQAIARWRDVDRVDKVGLNLRWLSRLHWYRGEVEAATFYIDQAVSSLETIAPGSDLAMTYSVRSQWHMLNDRTQEAVLWGERAIELAARLGDLEVRVHALNNIGTALLLAGDNAGRSYLDESLSLALANDLHEHAARVYTNLSEYAIAFKEFDLARQTIDDGIKFDTQYDLDSWLYYLLGCQAQLFMERGDFRAAELLARDVLGKTSLTLVMKLPAATVLARILIRQGQKEGAALIETVLASAITTKEAQRIVPARLALAEAAWLAGDDARCLLQIEMLDGIADTHCRPWEMGEILCWRKRAGKAVVTPRSGLPEPRVAELQGHALAAADRLGELGLPYDQALALTGVEGEEAGPALAQAMALFEKLGAHAAVGRIRRIAQDRQLSAFLSPLRRGPYQASRLHPLGLTFKEQQVLALIGEGATNRKIASTMSRSHRTIEHHVSSILAKLGVQSRLEAMVRVHREPWLIQTEQTKIAVNVAVMARIDC